jgi:hypothetical protein
MAPDWGALTAPDPAASTMSRLESPCVYSW